MWLPKFLYESIPFYYLGLGALALSAAFYVEAWYWSELLAAGGVVGLVAGLVLVLRRTDYRLSRSRRAFRRSR